MPSRKPLRRPSASKQSHVERAVELLLELLPIPGPSGQEAAVVAFLQRQLLRAGARPSQLKVDQAHRRSRFGGEVGNLILKLPGTLRQPRRLFVAHCDTVPLCVGCRPIQTGNRVRAKDAETGLGADNRAGSTVLLATAAEILRGRLPHPPLVFLWPVQEEVGLQGSRNVALSGLGKPKLAFNFDGGAPEKLTIGATGGYRMTIQIQGVASHAGNAPQEGVSAIEIAALAIADLRQQGWLGAVHKRARRGTSNIGILRGGRATNVVCDEVQIEAEARSHDAQFREQIVTKMQQAFHRAAGRVKSASGKTGRVKIEGRLDYEAYCLSRSEACVLAAAEAVRFEGLTPEYAIANGGLDANWLTAHGIPTVSLGCGQLNIHTTAEALDLRRFRQACSIALRLATLTAERVG